MLWTSCVTQLDQVAWQLCQCADLSAQAVQKVLRARQSKLFDDGIAALSGSFGKCPNIQELDLGWNGITHLGAKVLADQFGKCAQLQILSLDVNNFSEGGANALGQCLAKLQKLQELDLSQCEITDAGAVATVKMQGRAGRETQHDFVCHCRCARS